MPADVALDRPSLTLPDWRAALKRRFKRPKLPNGRLLLWLVWDAIFFGIEAWVFSTGVWAGAIVCAAIACDAAIVVRKIRRDESMRVRNPKDLVLRRAMWALWATGIACFFLVRGVS